METKYKYVEFAESRSSPAKDNYSIHYLSKLDGFQQEAVGWWKTEERWAQIHRWQVQVGDCPYKQVDIRSLSPKQVGSGRVGPLQSNYPSG